MVNQILKSEKRFWLHLGVFLFLNQGLLVHSNSPPGNYGKVPRARQRLKIPPHSHSEPEVRVKLPSQDAIKGYTENVDDDPPNIKDVAQLILDQEKLMEESESQKSLVKRFVNFLRSAYPLEMPMWSEIVQNRVRRSTGGWQHRRRRFIIKSRRRKQQTGKDKEKSESKLPTSSCGCKSITECPEQDEPDKFKLFYSNPPLCRPTPTPDPLDGMPSTDMCGHSCLCHNTEALTTDNDKEIYVGRRKTTVNNK